MHRLKSLGSPRLWFRRIVEARSGQVALFWVSFLEGVILPVPLEAVLAPYMQMRRDILWRLAAVGLAGFLAAALLGYAIGALLFDAVGIPILAALGWTDEFASAEGFILNYGVWALIVIVTTPIPSQIALLGAGAAGFPLVSFVLAMVLARGTRYYGIGLLVLMFGDRVVAWFTRDRAAAPVEIDR